MIEDGGWVHYRNKSVHQVRNTVDVRCPSRRHAASAPRVKGEVGGLLVQGQSNDVNDHARLCSQRRGRVT